MVDDKVNCLVLVFFDFNEGMMSKMWYRLVNGKIFIGCINFLVVFLIFRLFFVDLFFLSRYIVM